MRTMTKIPELAKKGESVSRGKKVKIEKKVKTGFA